jgi:uncharacterized lipoprotein YbaY
VSSRHRTILAEGAVVSRIEVGGEQAWISDTHHPIATDGPTTVDVVDVDARSR